MTQEDIARALNVVASTNQKLVVVGGGGNLAGATIVNPLWNTNTQVHLMPDGTDSINHVSTIQILLLPYGQ
jgi:hypothetical protein